MRLTDAGIARLRPDAREYTVWDTRTPGLGVRVRPSGGKSFVLLHKTDGRSRRASLGAVAARCVDAVRRECHAAIAEGAPDAAMKPEAPLLRDFVAGPWTDAHFPKYKPSTRQHARAALSNQLLPAFGATPLDRITRAQVLEWFDAYSETAPGGANRTVQLLCQVLNFAVACGHIPTNPARAIEPNRRTALTRFLSREEVQRLHRALDRNAPRSTSARAQADIIRLLLLTGCRKNEILALRWAEVHADALALADSKTGPRKVPLNAKAPARPRATAPGRESLRLPLPARHRPPADLRPLAVGHGAPRGRHRGRASPYAAPHGREPCGDERRPGARRLAAARPRQRADDASIRPSRRQGHRARRRARRCGTRARDGAQDHRRLAQGLIADSRATCSPALDSAGCPDHREDSDRLASHNPCDRCRSYRRSATSAKGGQAWNRRFAAQSPTRGVIEIRAHMMRGHSGSSKEERRYGICPIELLLFLRRRVTSSFARFFASLFGWQVGRKFWPSSTIAA